MARLYFNNVFGVVAAGGFAQSATTLPLGDASLFPDPGSDWYLVTLSDLEETEWEIVKVTAKSGNNLTVERAQEGSSDIAWDAGDKVELRATAEAFTPAAIGAVATGDMPTAMSQAVAETGTSTTPQLISAEVLKAGVIEHTPDDAPIPIGTALTDLTGLELNQTLRTYDIDGADLLTVTTHVAGSWAIIRCTETTAGAITHTGITWIGGTDHNDITDGCEILLRSDGTTVFASVGVPT